MENEEETIKIERTIADVNVDYTREAALFGDAMFKTFIRMLHLDNEAKKLVKTEQTDV